MCDESKNNDLAVQDEVLIAIRQITQAIDLHSRYLIKNHNITGPQLILMRVVKQNGSISITEIAKHTSLSISTVTGILARLEKRGFINRAKCETDKRRVIVNLTQQGNKFLKKAPEPFQDAFLFNFNRLENWEKLMVLSSLQRLVSLMKAEDIDVSPILATGPLTPSQT
jgi:DNA-binding MarR family transcriptional regulator